jgi:cobalt-precorrin 5A hydrolase
MPVFIGMGCDRNTSLVTLETALAQALQLAGLTPAVITAFASIDKKADEVALLVLAQQYGCPLYFYTAEQLASVPVPNPSEVVRHYMGTPAVAEAAALLAANTTLEHLLVEKHKYRGADDKNATVSIVRI